MRADRVILGLVVVLLGLGLLLFNLGLLPMQPLWELRRYWPVLLILWGILLLVGRGDGGYGCLVGLAVFTLVATIVYSFAFTPLNGEVVFTDYELPLPGEIGQLQLNLFQGAGELELKEIPAADDLLVKAKIRTHAKASIIETTEGEKMTVEIRDPGFSGSLRNRASLWDVRVAQGIPLSIRIRTGAAQAELDFRRLQVNNLEIKAGAGDLTLHLGASGGDYVIEGGAGSLTFYVPSNVGLRMKISGGLIDLDDGEEKLVSLGDREYESKNIEGKDVIVNIRITMGAGEINILPAAAKGML